MTLLKEKRKDAGITQTEAAKLLKVSLRSYKDYENNENKVDSLKYQYLVEKITDAFRIDEEHGILKQSKIVDICSKIFEKYPVEYCYLFGSYARGDANDKSDVDLLVSTEIDGLSFYGLLEELKTKLRKNVDLLDLRQLNNNLELTSEVLKDGIKIYERNKKR